MARTPKPWWNEDKKAWYVWLNGKKKRLAKTKKDAMDVFYDLMAHPEKAVIRSGSVAEIAEHFLDWTKANRAEKTYQWYKDIIGRFLEQHELQVNQLKPFHIERWMDANQWSNEYRRACVTALKRVFNFAVKQGYIELNPLKNLDKPEATSRDLVISQKEYKKILKMVPDQEFSDLLTFLWETGCRPQEATQARPKHVNLKAGTITFPPEEAPKGNKTRVIYLTDRALDIVRKKMFNDPLFLNTKGRAWTAFAIDCRFKKLQLAMAKAKMKKSGVKVTPEEIDNLAAILPKLVTKRKDGEKVEKTKAELRREARDKLIAKKAADLAPKYYAYAFRHSYGYHAWTSGRVPPEEIAKLMGHVSTDMLYKTYGHVEQNPEYMRDAARRVRGA
ncbi:site-specific tyrosine recombinase XerC [Symmachiella dynata]|uniref:tyrosine-type recombinase/integrase n=1 Tax=Symmachiella dynata TaxID=2527995 RepID=UPI00118A9894|nr:site-specific integrase [Symmachiella dynata]QDT46140.1 site-specific tyrosine recombinase XerC [Symmachiella dynata]